MYINNVKATKLVPRTEKLLKRLSKFSLCQGGVPKCVYFYIFKSAFLN